MKLESKYEVQAAHRLAAGVPVGHPCRRLHGHRYNIEVTVDGFVDAEIGMVMEYADIDKRVWELLEMVDHRFLNELGAVPSEYDPADLPKFTAHLSEHLREPDLAAKVRQNSTVEHFVQWLFSELQHRFDGRGPQKVIVTKVRIQEDSGHTAELP